MLGHKWWFTRQFNSCLLTLKLTQSQNPFSVCDKNNKRLQAGTHRSIPSWVLGSYLVCVCRCHQTHESRRHSVLLRFNWSYGIIFLCLCCGGTDGGGRHGGGGDCIFSVSPRVICFHVVSTQQVFPLLWPFLAAVNSFLEFYATNKAISTTTATKVKLLKRRLRQLYFEVRTLLCWVVNGRRNLIVSPHTFRARTT